MPSCPKCYGFSERFNIREPWDYRDVVRQLIEVVDQGTLLFVCGSCPLQDLLKGPWLGDSLSHEFKCFACGRMFYLHADTYHGHASWSVGELPRPTDDSAQPN